MAYWDQRESNEASAEGTLHSMESEASVDIRTLEDVVDFVTNFEQPCLNLPICAYENAWKIAETIDLWFVDSESVG